MWEINETKCFEDFLTASVYSSHSEVVMTIIRGRLEVESQRAHGGYTLSDSLLCSAASGCLSIIWEVMWHNTTMNEITQ